MADEPGPDADGGQSMLAQLSTEMVRLQKEYYGKGPTKAKSYMLDDFLIIVMRGGVTPSERTLLDAGKEDLVRDYRQQFQNEMGDKLRGMVEDVTGRSVVQYQSQVMFDPDVTLEVFLFDEDAHPAGIDATVDDQRD